MSKQRIQSPKRRRTLWTLKWPFIRIYPLERKIQIRKRNIRDRSCRCKCPLRANVRVQCGHTNRFFFGSFGFGGPSLDICRPRRPTPFPTLSVSFADPPSGELSLFSPELQLSALSAWAEFPPPPTRRDVRSKGSVNASKGLCAGRRW